MNIIKIKTVNELIFNILFFGIVLITYHNEYGISTTKMKSPCREKTFEPGLGPGKRSYQKL